MDEQDKQALAAMLENAPDPGQEVDPERAAMLEAMAISDRNRAQRAASLVHDAEWRDD
jgi:hypothetical protein